MAFGDYQLEIYLNGLGGVLPTLPMGFPELEERARASLPPSVWSYVAGGAGDERTQRANVEAFDRWGLIPRMLVGAKARDLSVDLFGMRLPSPVFLAPIGVIGLCDQAGHGDLATARAAARTGVPMVASTLSVDPLEQVAAEMGETPGFFQLYTPTDRDLAASLVTRAEKAGFKGIVVTLDTWITGWRPRDLAMSNFPQLRGHCLANYTSDPVFRASLARGQEEDPSAVVMRFVQVFGNPLTWDDLPWLRSLTTLPLILKGICHPDDARRARDAGIDAIYCSNHGGRQANGGLPALDMLPEVVTAADGLPVLFDSGVRGGADIIKALALGATAVGIGRPYAYGLALGGADGIVHVLRMLLAEADLIMAVDGYPALADLTPAALRRVTPLPGSRRGISRSRRPARFPGMSTGPGEETRHHGWLLGVLLTGPFMAQADVTIVNVATPSIHADLGASGATLQLVVGGYLIALAMLLITGARLGQAFGYRRAFVAGVSLFTLASLACGLAPDPAVLVVARVSQGAAAGVMFPQTLTGIQLHFSGADRVRAISRYALALSAGAVSGQVLGGLLVSADVAGLGWRSVFLVNVPVGTTAAVAGLRWLPADGRSQSRLDLAGVALLSVTVLLIVVPLTLGGPAGWPAWSWACLAASLPAAAAFIAAERLVAARGGVPLLDVGLLAIPVVRWSLVALMTASGTYYVLLFTVAQYLQGGLGQSPVQSGLTLVPWVAAFGLAGQVVRRLPASRRLPAAGCLLLTAAYAGISGVLFAGRGGDALLVPLLAAGGLGLGVNFAALTGHMTGAVPARHAPDISGVSSTLMSIGGSIGVAAIGSLYLALARTGTPAAHGAAIAAHAFAVTTVALAALGVLATLAAHRATRPGTATATRAQAPGETEAEMAAL